MPRVTRSSIHQDALAPSPVYVKAEPLQLSSLPSTPVPVKSKTKRDIVGSALSTNKAGSTSGSDAVENSPTSRKRTRTHVKYEDDFENVPRSLGGKLAATKEITSESPAKKVKKARKSRSPDLKSHTSEPQGILVEKKSPKVDPGTSPSKKTKKKDTTYGLTPGETPFPDWPHPTPEECQEINRVLSKVHGTVKAPKTIPKPSLTSSGCGEVPSVLDALIRTRLSAATSGSNSSRAFKGLIDRFGILKTGVGKGSVDWDAVRRADVTEVFEAIKSGGLAKVKSKDIKEILQTVYEENQERREALLESQGKTSGTDLESSEEKMREINLAESSVISLDHLHQLPDKEAFDKLVKYPGIGPKTASCVLLFCLQRPSFAVDTHVFRLVSWLDWVPPNATRNTAYAHCDVKIPDDLKYPLHYLLIKHGKTCPRCRANTSEGYKSWEDGCPIEHLVKRSGVRKGGTDNALGSAKKKTPKKVKKALESDQDGSSELSDLSDLGSDDDV